MASEIDAIHGKITGSGGKPSAYDTAAMRVWTVTANGVTWTIQNDVSSGFWAIYDGGAYVAERGQGSVNLDRALARKRIG